MSDYIKQKSTYTKFSSNEPWVILSSIELGIKEKIEKVGTPLREWNIKIYRGILTGFNEAFIISEEKRAEILSRCKTEGERRRTDEVIRPILRGKDIKRYGVEWKKLYLINFHNGIPKNNIPPLDIVDFPSLKKHFDYYYSKLVIRDDKGYTPYNLRSCAYLDVLNQPKILYSEIVQGPQFYYDEKNNFLPEATAFSLTGDNIEYLYMCLNSHLIAWIFKNFYAGGGLGEHGYRYKKAFLENLPIPKDSSFISKIKNIIKNKENIDINIDKALLEFYKLTTDEIKYIESVN